MRYLVQIESIDSGENMPPRQVAALLEDIVIPTMKVLVEWEKMSKAKGGILSGRRGAAFVIDAASNEELSDLLRGLPVWGFSEVEITPLDSAEHRIQAETQAAQMMKNM
jgi:muconolactone delta-isomerase